ncbi:general odorant-binding protein 56d-like [Musca vetustissima]|uniref:general odorant-binding protein 56d-like n=1 Tax=Musca vetustissima TaxID=27455 RepID=UPI002AB68996|nr:general odorant-binding protein 56d-like [Musca vetustissima]
MKTILVLLLVIDLANLIYGHVPVKVPEDQKARTAQIAAECIAQEKITPEQAIEFSKGEFTKADKNVKCYANCFLTKAGVVVDGVVQTSVVMEKMGPTVGEEKLKATMEKCSKLKGSDHCETAFMMFECYHKEHADIA